MKKDAKESLDLLGRLKEIHSIVDQGGAIAWFLTIVGIGASLWQIAFWYSGIWFFLSHCLFLFYCLVIFYAIIRRRHLLLLSLFATYFVALAMTAL